MPIYKTKEKNKDGLVKYRVSVNYIKPDGKYGNFTRIAYGLVAAKEMERKLNSGSKASTTITIEELITEYLEMKKYKVRASTLDKTARILKRYLLPVYKIRLNKLDIQKIVDWKHELEESNLKITTKKNVFGEFRAMINWAVKVGKTKFNPLTQEGNFINPYQEKKEIQYYTADEYRQYASAALEIAKERDYYDYYVFFSILFFTGLRKGENHALKWTDRKYKDGVPYLSVSKSLTQKLKGQGDTITPPKNYSSNRIIEEPTPLTKILDEHYKRCKKYKGFNDDMFICGGIKPLRDTALSNMKEEITKKSKLHTIRIHDFRHSHASFLINGAVNILEVSRRLGHSDIKETLNTYSHLYPSEESKATSILNNF